MSTPEQSAGEQRRVAILGSGYTAAVAAEQIDRHPNLELAAVTSRHHAGERFDEVCASWGVPLRAVPIRLEDPANLFEDLEDRRLDVAIVAYPPGQAAVAVEELRSSGVRVIDLGADFRLHDSRTYEKWYGPHSALGLLESGEAVYGLTELNREKIHDAELVASPGCYPTASVLSLAPLAREGLIKAVKVDAYSGTSGGGKEKADQYLASPKAMIRYGENGHRHQPEIEQELAELGYHGKVEFCPWVMRDVFQGMIVHCDVTPRRDVAMAELRELYQDAYRDEPFVNVAEEPVSLDDVRGTNLCRILLGRGAEGQVLIAAYIDNLWKGASGQAVQNLNLMHGLPEETGLPASTLERIAG